ncbi:MAG TPA: CPBP family intramembrane glutamic endopeptidase [Acidobacteriaceae bacterium]|nr:CPBP family intramembrane glutamic endopeptidase [Acidobacteriaceae bacterium]
MTNIPPDPLPSSIPPETGSEVLPLNLNSQPTRPPILYGRDGLRAGWSVLLFLCILLPLLVLFGYETRWIALRLHESMPGSSGGELHPTIAIWSEATSLIAVLLATAIMARLERRHTASYGLTGTARARQFFVGLVSGFGFLSLLIAILAGTHHIALTRPQVSMGKALGYGVAWGICFLLVALTEELMLRGYLLFTLARGIRFWPAAVFLGALFGLLHKSNSGESPFGLVAAAMVALLFSLSLWRLGHLWWAIGFHAAWDWGESFFYGTADSGLVSTGRLMHAHPSGSLLGSGGSTGPEGSVWVVPVLILAALFVWFTQAKSKSLWAQEGS